jgi:hypothetical protein
MSPHTYQLMSAIGAAGFNNVRDVAMTWTQNGVHHIRIVTTHRLQNVSKRCPERRYRASSLPRDAPEQMDRAVE